MGSVTFLAPASSQWLLPEVDMMNVLRRLLGNESPFGWCDFVTSIEPSGPQCGILRPFWASRPPDARGSSLRDHVFTDRRSKTHSEPGTGCNAHQGAVETRELCPAASLRAR